MNITDPVARHGHSLAGHPAAEGDIRQDSLRLEGGWLFRHSALDGLLVLLSLGNAAALAATALAFERLGGWALAGLALFFMAMICTNYQCIAHNHIHNPFFRHEGLNRLFAVLNSLSLGMPQTLYRVHHLNHHRYNNDLKDPLSGLTGDLSSLYRFSLREGQPENIWCYSLLGPLRTDFALLYRIARRRRLDGQVRLESAALVAFYAGLAWLDWRFALFYFLPVLYAGQVLALAENYLEHYGADPRDRRTDSVSCYGRLYNLLWFNNGYHQEHHFRPGVHWRLVPRLRPAMLPEDRRRVVRGAHVFNFFRQS